MKLVRFMSLEELGAYLRGEKLRSDTVHAERGMKSTSVGFCFAETTPCHTALSWLIKLTGLTAHDAVVEFDTKRCPAFTESRGRYWDSRSENTRMVREWCTREYSLATHPFTRIGAPLDPIAAIEHGLVPMISWTAQKATDKRPRHDYA